MVNNNEASLPFSSLTKDEEERLFKVSSQKKYSKGEIIFSKGELGNSVWILRSGRVHLQNVTYDGKVVTSCVMTGGDIFCCLPALDGKPYPTDAIVVEDAVILKVPAEKFRTLMDGNPTFSRQVICTFCDHLRLAESRGCQAYDPAELRMARLLLSLARKFKNEIPLTRQEMAEMAGITVETAIRIMSQMKKDGMIRSSRKKTSLISVEKLEELVKAS